ncbi:DUF2339 domain-containing protein, partial [Azospirillum brasilense]|uniref:DUF2339 domain-containing protein n=1 Tax=Azospirillum brasilense TaxID=192 RepID=UPI0012DD6681
LHGSPVMYRSAYPLDLLDRLARRFRDEARERPVWCVFDNTADFHAVDDALTLMSRLGASTGLTAIVARTQAQPGRSGMDVILLVLIGAIVAHRFNRRLTAQEREIARLRQALERVQGPVTVDAAPVEVPAADTAVMVEAPPEPPPIQPPPIQPPPEPSPPPLSVWSRLDWLGGATVALAAAFFIKMSIEQGWLGPGVRVTLGLLSAAALMVGGEWLRQRGGGAEPGGRDPVPPALTAAGLFTGFASVYGGYVLYDLFAPPLAFALLGGLAALGMALSLLQGPYIAALGLLGGFATPLLVSSIGGSAWGLFAYLLALSGAGMTVVLWRGWRWLGLGTLVGAAGWVPVWYVGGWNPGDALPVGIYLLLNARPAGRAGRGDAAHHPVRHAALEGAPARRPSGRRGGGGAGAADGDARHRGRPSHRLAGDARPVRAALRRGGAADRADRRRRLDRRAGGSARLRRLDGAALAPRHRRWASHRSIAGCGAAIPVRAVPVGGGRLRPAVRDVWLHRPVAVDAGGAVVVAGGLDAGGASGARLLAAGPVAGRHAVADGQPGA